MERSDLSLKQEIGYCIGYFIFVIACPIQCHVSKRPICTRCCGPSRHGMARFHVGDRDVGAQLRRVAANVSNETLGTAEKGWSSSFVLGPGIVNSYCKK
jgi:hypothetical protein